MTRKDTRDRRHDRSREHILTAARELVLEAGPERLSLRKVAERAHFSPSSLYEYFDGKDDIVRQLSARVMARLDLRMAQVPATLDPPRRLVRYGMAYVAFAAECPEDFLLSFMHLRSQRSAPSEQVGAQSPYARILAAVRTGLDDGSLAGPERDPETVAYGLWAVAHGLAMLQVTHLKGYAMDFEAADRAVIETYVRGLQGG